MANSASIDLDKGAGHAIDPALVPAALHPLISYVEVWGFKSLEDQDAFAIAMLRDRPDAVKAFNAIVDAHDAAIRDWRKDVAFAGKHMSTFTDDDLSHPYWLFLSALKVREITGDSEVIPPEQIAARERFRAELRREQHASAAAAADEAFRRGDFFRIRPTDDAVRGSVDRCAEGQARCGPKKDPSRAISTSSNTGALEITSLLQSHKGSQLHPVERANS